MILPLLTVRTDVASYLDALIWVYTLVIFVRHGTTPTTGQKIETSNQFTSAWINSDRSGVALSTDRTADPNGVVDPVRQSWTELIPTGN